MLVIDAARQQCFSTSTTQVAHCDMRYKGIEVWKSRGLETSIRLSTFHTQSKGELSELPDTAKDMQVLKCMVK